MEEKKRKKKGGKNRSIRGYGIIGNDQGLGEPEWGGWNNEDDTAFGACI